MRTIKDYKVIRTIKNNKSEILKHVIIEIEDPDFEAQY